MYTLVWNGSTVHGWAQRWTMIAFPFLWNFVFPRVSNGLGLWKLFIYLVFSVLIANSFHARSQYCKHLWYYLLQNQTHREFRMTFSVEPFLLQAGWAALECCYKGIIARLHSTSPPCGSPLFRIHVPPPAWFTPSFWSLYALVGCATLGSLS